jgi:hypothetical protein
MRSDPKVVGGSRIYLASFRVRQNSREGGVRGFAPEVVSVTIFGKRVPDFNWASNRSTSFEALRARDARAEPDGHSPIGDSTGPIIERFLDALETVVNRAEALISSTSS